MGVLSAHGYAPVAPVWREGRQGKSEREELLLNPDPSSTAWVHTESLASTSIRETRLAVSRKEPKAVASVYRGKATDSAPQPRAVWRA